MAKSVFLLKKREWYEPVRNQDGEWEYNTIGVFTTEEKAIELLEANSHLKRNPEYNMPYYDSDICNAPNCENAKDHCDSFYVKEVPLDDLNTKLFWDWEECVTKEE